jgi:diguanylate cyclase (GGDEF)-like protein/PAS domain S-box-containing protein
MDIIETIKDGYFEIDLAGRLTFFNDSLCEIHGYPKEELMGTDNRRYADKENAKKAFAAFNEIYKTGKAGSIFDYEIIRKNGTKRQVEVSASLKRDSLGKPIGFRGITRDVTERKQAEGALRSSEERYRAFVENASDVVFQTDATGHFTFANPAMLHISGYSETEFIGMHYRKLIRPDKYEEAMKVLVGQYQRRIQNTYHEFPIVTKDGREKWIGQNTQLLFENGEPSGFQAVARDITDKKLMEESLQQSEEKYRTILENIEDGYYEADIAGKFTFFNNSMCRIFGYPQEELMGMSIRQYADKENAKKIFQTFNEVYRTGTPAERFDWQIIRKDGAIRFGEASVSLIKDPSGNPVGFRGVTRDITERKQAEEAIRESEERYRTFVENASDIIFRTDVNGRFTFANQAMLRITGYSEEEFIGKHYRALIRQDKYEEVMKLLTGQYKSRIPNTYQEFPIVRKDGQEKWIGQNTQLLFENGEPSGFQAVARDITENKLAEEKIQYMASHDSLTGLPNRMMFSHLLNHSIQTAKRYQKQIAVLFMDLDRFKIINDTLGHDAGDLLLQVVASRLKQTLRSADVVARLGGDEFVILIEEVKNSNQLEAVAKKILSAVMTPITILSEECRVTVSVGISVFPSDGQDEQTLMKNADNAMYFAKEEGKNTFKFYSSYNKSHAVERLSIENNLRFALERNELKLVYQAKVDFKTGLITGVEALLRWDSPVLGPITPTQFIPVAEQTGLIVPIGRWVMETACAQNVAWQKQALPPVCMAVNLSLRQLLDEYLLADIRKVLKSSGMAPNLLELEITESMVMYNPERVINTLFKIKNLGVRLAIDDFGTGYSSLSQMRYFPVDTLKIDRSFIRNIPKDSEDKAITQAIIKMGKTLSLSVVAEGVETKEQMEFLREQSCDEMQGFYFSKPVAPEIFAKLLGGHDT